MLLCVQSLINGHFKIGEPLYASAERWDEDILFAGDEISFLPAGDKLKAYPTV